MSDDGIEIRLIGVEDAALLERAIEDVFDDVVRPELAREFAADPRHHIAVALEDGALVGFASGLHYVHPDKASEFFVNEVGVAPSHQRRGIGARVVRRLLEQARALGCREAWVATEIDNVPARALYVATGGVKDPTPAVVYTYRLDPEP